MENGSGSPFSQILLRETSFKADVIRNASNNINEKQISSEESTFVRANVKRNNAQVKNVDHEKVLGKIKLRV